MTADQELSLAHHFADLTDPRIDRSRLHELLDIVAIAICAVVAGADSWDDIEDFGNAKHRLAQDLPGPAQRHPLARHLPPPLRAARPRRVPAGLPRLDRGLCTRRPSGRSSPSTARRLRRSFDRAKGEVGPAPGPRLGHGQPPAPGPGRRGREVQRDHRHPQAAEDALDLRGDRDDRRHGLPEGDRPHDPGPGGRLRAGVEGQPRAPLRAGRGVLGPGVCPAEEGAGHPLPPGVVRGPRPDRGPAVLGHLGPHLAGGPGGSGRT